MPTTMDLSCCCGQLQCAYLNYSNAAIKGLEKELRGAAQIGQALLIRHENYVAKAEEEHRMMMDSMEKLEGEKSALEAANVKTIEQNRFLLNELEDLNQTVSDSDAHIFSLTSTLKSTHQELERLTSLAARSTQLESQLLELELEQQLLREQLVSAEGDQRSAVQRWKSAERTINILQEQVERVEAEAKDGRRKHEEVVSRFERRRAVERELENAAGRLKGAAAATSLENNSGNNSVVSHFVKDILQDNAHLQMGIVELRAMLEGSNEEIESLREQMLLHQPALTPNEDGSTKLSLKSELENIADFEALPELHVHHHYHSAGKPKAAVREKSYGSRRPRNRRSITATGFRTPPSGLQNLKTPSTPNMRTAPPLSIAAGPSQTTVIKPPPTSRAPRWSTESFSSIAPSSVPSSPQSGYRTSSIFDNIDTTVDYSRPTSPESAMAESPIFSFQHKRGFSDISLNSLTTPLASEPSFEPQYVSSVSRAKARGTRRSSLDQVSDMSVPAMNSSVIPEEPEPDPTASDQATYSISDSSTTSTSSATPTFRPLLCRSTSHESILSIPPLTIPNLRQNPSQGFPSHRLSSLSAASPQTLINPTSATAQLASRSLGRSSSTYNRSLLSTFMYPPNTIKPHVARDSKSPTLGRRVGGWVLGRWAGAIPPTGDGPDAKTALNNLQGDTDDRAAAPMLRSSHHKRATGVNQKGSIRALRPDSVKVPRIVEIGEVDENLLRESLKEG